MKMFYSDTFLERLTSDEVNELTDGKEIVSVEGGLYVFDTYEEYINYTSPWRL